VAERKQIMDPHTVTKSAASETPFPHLELWEDASRIPDTYKPECFEWWYFDAQLTDGRTVVVVFSIAQDTGKRKFVYNVVATITSPGQQPVAATYTTNEDVLISREHPEGRISKSSFHGDLDTYRVIVDENELGKLGLDVTIRRTIPPRVSPNSGQFIVQGDKVFGWVCAVPQGELTGTITVNGATIAVNGVAYHDHNWGTTSMGSMENHWIWGRAAIGPYTAVFVSNYPTHAFSRDRTDGLQQLFIASEREVLVNVEGFGTARVTAPIAPNPDPRNAVAFYSPRTTFEVEQNGKRFAVEADAAQFIGSLDLATQSNFLSPDEITRAARMEHKPWYSRFVAAPVTLSLTDGGETETHSGQGIIEFMDMHLNE
jgi:hypothetical protein